jgi:hypothetical protein
MEGEVLRLAVPQSMPRDDVRLRLKRLAAILTAIEAGELFSALPGSPEAKGLHQAGVELLAILGQELDALIADLD